MLWWSIGIWVGVTIALAVLFGATGWLFDEDWGIFFVACAVVWPLIIGGLAVAILGILPFGLLYVVVKLVGGLVFKQEVGRNMPPSADRREGIL